MSMIATVCWMAPTPNHYGLVVLATFVVSGIGQAYVPKGKQGCMVFHLSVSVVLAWCDPECTSYVLFLYMYVLHCVFQSLLAVE